MEKERSTHPSPHTRKSHPSGIRWVHCILPTSYNRDTNFLTLKLAKQVLHSKQSLTKTPRSNMTGGTRHCQGRGQTFEVARIYAKTDDVKGAGVVDLDDVKGVRVAVPLRTRSQELSDAH